MPTSRRRGLAIAQALAFLAFDVWIVLLAIPMMQDCGCGGGSPRSKAAQDLEIFKKAISLYDAREPAAFAGHDLEPLRGRYMQEIPRDPWGRRYLLDTDLGLLASLGRDGCVGGTGTDYDVWVRLRPPARGAPEDPPLADLARRHGIQCQDQWFGDERRRVGDVAR